MACNCRDMMPDIMRHKKEIDHIRELFWKRLTEDSPHQDRRRSDYNQALFDHWGDDPKVDEKEWFQCFCQMTPHMIIRAFDDAVKDWRKCFCDVEGCKRTRWECADDGK